MNVKKLSVEIYPTKYEQYLRMLDENEGFEYILASRFHDKYLMDENSLIYHIVFSDEERIKCAIENIEHYAKMTASCEAKGENESTMQYQDKLIKEKELLTNLIEDLL